MQRSSTRKSVAWQVMAPCTVACWLLAACGQDAAPPVPAEVDPAIDAALNQPLMVDTDLSDNNGPTFTLGGNEALIPLDDRTPEARANAIKGALALVGGRFLPLPKAVPGDGSNLARDAATAAQVAQRGGISNVDCSAKAEYSATWAAEMPAEFPVYPRGAVQEAAGTNSNGCKLRIVNFLTAVSPVDVMTFYHTRAVKAGFDATYRIDKTEHVLGGQKARRAYVVYARDRNGITEVDLVASGT